MQPVKVIGPLALAITLTFGCGCRPRSPATEVSAGLHIASRDDLIPSEIAKDTVITVAGTRREMTVETSHDGSRFEVALIQHGMVDDREVYEDLPGSFSLVEAAGETYNPPLPILKFPMNVGERWTWEGTSDAGNMPLKVSAVVTTSETSVFLCEMGIESVQATVQLSIKTDEGSSIERRLRFFFAPGHGLFKREFGPSSVRETACK